MSNFYSKLTCICFMLVFCVAAIITIYILIYLNSNRIASIDEEYDEILSEMVQTYNDIWENNYKVFMPIITEDNMKSFQQFCKGEYDGYEKIEGIKEFKSILNEICQQDKWIKGVYFRRYSDHTCYLYFKEDKKLMEVSFELAHTETMQDLNHILIGAREMSYDITSKSKKRVNAFGIRSRTLSATKVMDNANYQITILYDVSCFDEILKEHSLVSGTRFFITSQQGLILYDSAGEYEENQESYFENISNITADEAAFTENEIVYVKNMKSIKKGDCLAFYIVPENNIRGFQLGGMSNVVIFVAIIIIALMGVVLVSVSQLIGRKFYELEKGICQVGMNNLKYRLPVEGQVNEFSRIAVHFNKMCDDLSTMIDKNYVYQVLQQKAEYQALKTSVNPHFLYNSLEAIREMLEEKGQDDAADVVLMLSRIFDYQIHGDSITTIWMELEALQNYIDFLSARYRHTFEYSIDFDDKILDYKAPKQIFQPIMENYFEHAFKGDGTDFIYILGYLDEEDDMIHISFCDNGKGIREEKKINISLEDDEEHVGLSNVYKRLNILFRKNCRVEINSNAPEPGVTVSLVFEKRLTIDA